ncbi:hypothetical protein TNCV_335581 [Trichonephila clavipes]|nr:hypothetical protein TNCV_335581 [Trichonephila clavipes]
MSQDNMQASLNEPIVQNMSGPSDFESPIAFRTRGIESYPDVAVSGFCKVCGNRFHGMIELWNHLHDEHQASERRSRAIEAFPMTFQLERMQEVLPNEEWASNPKSPPTMHFLENLAPTEDGEVSNAAGDADRRDDQPTTTRQGCRSPTRSSPIVQSHSHTFGSTTPQAQCSIPDVAGVKQPQSPVPTKRRTQSLPPMSASSPAPVDSPHVTDEAVIKKAEGKDIHATGPEPRRTQASPAVKDSEKTAQHAQQHSSVTRITPDKGETRATTSKQEGSPASPSILDMLLEEDTTLPGESATQISPALQNKQEEGPPPKPRSPTFAEKARKGANKKPSVPMLLHCVECGQKFYTNKGLEDHKPGCNNTAGVAENNKDRKTQESKEHSKSSKETLGKSTEVAGQKTGTNRETRPQPKKHRKPVRPTYCKYCASSIFLLTTLEDHYLRRHHRQLSPQNVGTSTKKDNAPKSKNVPRTEETVIHQRTGQSATSNTTLANPNKAGKLVAKKLMKNCVCIFCEKKFATRQALEPHARAVHDVEDEITYTFKSNVTSREKPLPNIEGATGGVRENDPKDDQPCRGDPTGSTTQATLDAKVITQTEKKTDNTRDVSNGTPSKARWCTHCAKNLSTGESLTHHIRTEHNDVVVKENDGQERTKVVHFKLEDVADASNCPSTPAYNVLCPVDRSPQDANPMPPGEYNIGASTSTSGHRNENPIPPGEYNIGASTSTSGPLQGLANRENFTCEHCRKSERSHKALQYHMVRAHGVPFKKESE